MQFEVWAPQADRVDAPLRGRDARDGARSGAAGVVDRRGGGARTARGTASRVDDGPVLPDPRSRRQPDGPDGLSAVVDHGRYAWRARVVRARAAGRGAVRAARRHVHPRGHPGRGRRTPRRISPNWASPTCELMPLCPFPGTHGWGYEGVSLWAVHEPYGGPEALKRFVDAAHGLGLGRRPGRGAQPPGPVRQLPARLRPVLHRHATTRPGARPSTWTRPARTRCGRTSWAARSPGCATTGSTGCGWTRCTRSPTPARCTSWRSCRRPWTRSPPSWAGRCS